MLLLLPARNLQEPSWHTHMDIYGIFSSKTQIKATGKKRVTPSMNLRRGQGQRTQMHTSPSGSRTSHQLGWDIYGSQCFGASKTSQNFFTKYHLPEPAPPALGHHCPVPKAGTPRPCFGGALGIVAVAGASPATWSPGGRGKHFPYISCLLIFSPALPATASETQRRSQAPASRQLKHSPRAARRENDTLGEVREHEEIG